MHLGGDFYRTDRFSKSDQSFISYDKIVPLKNFYIFDEKIALGKFGDTSIKTSLGSMALWHLSGTVYRLYRWKPEVGCSTGSTVLPSCWSAPVNMIYKEMDFQIGHNTFSLLLAPFLIFRSCSLFPWVSRVILPAP